MSSLPAGSPTNELHRLDDILRDRWLSNPVSDAALERALMALLSAGRIRPRALFVHRSAELRKVGSSSEINDGDGQARNASWTRPTAGHTGD